MGRPKKSKVVSITFFTPVTGEFKLKIPAALMKTGQYQIAIIDTAEYMIIPRKDYADGLRAKANQLFDTAAEITRANIAVSAVPMGRVSSKPRRVPAKLVPKVRRIVKSDLDVAPKPRKSKKITK